MRIQNETKTVRATGEAVDRRYHRGVLAARSGTVRTPSERGPQMAVEPSMRKQPGRRYGPPPKNPPHPRMQAPTPMTTGRRFEAYTAATLIVTPRQRRQLYRLGLLHDDPWALRSDDAKGRRTPKRPVMAR